MKGGGLEDSVVMAAGRGSGRERRGGVGAQWRGGGYPCLLPPSFTCLSMREGHIIYIYIYNVAAVSVVEVNQTPPCTIAVGCLCRFYYYFYYIFPQ